MKKVSLAEIMGKDAASKSDGLRLSHLSDILGDNMPELPRNPVGRHRLIRALQQRFGNQWRTLPGVKNLVKEFDGEVAFENKINQIRSVRMRRKDG